MTNIKNNKNISAVYLLKGTQDLLIERELEKLREQLVGETNDFNYFVTDAQDFSVSEILDNLNTTSMFDRHKMVVVKNAESLKSGDIKILKRYMESPSPGSYLVLLSNDTKKPSFGRQKNLSVKSFGQTNNLENSIFEEAKNTGINLSKDAVSLLHDLLGDDLRSIRNEIIKLSQFYTDKKKINARDVRKFVSDRTEENVFELTNAVSDRNLKKAISVLAQLESQGNDPVSIISTLSWRFRQLAQTKHYLSERIAKKDIMEKVGTSSGALYFLTKQCGNFSFDELARIYGSLQSTDRKLKSTPQEPYNLISGLILDICSDREGESGRL